MRWYDDEEDVKMPEWRELYYRNWGFNIWLEMSNSLLPMIDVILEEIQSEADHQSDVSSSATIGTLSSLLRDLRGQVIAWTKQEPPNEFVEGYDDWSDS